MKNKILKYALVAFLIFGVIVLVFFPNEPRTDIDVQSGELFVEDVTDNYLYDNEFGIDPVKNILLYDEWSESIIIKTKEEGIDFLDSYDEYLFYKDDNKIKVFSLNDKKSYIINIPSNYEYYSFGVDNEGIFGVVVSVDNKASYIDFETGKTLYKNGYDYITILSRDYLEGELYDHQETDNEYYNGNQKTADLISAHEEKVILTKENTNEEFQYLAFYYINVKNKVYYVFSVADNGGTNRDEFYKEIYDSNMNLIFKTDYKEAVSYNSKTETEVVNINTTIGTDGNIYVYEKGIFKEYDYKGNLVKQTKISGEYVVLAREYVLSYNKNNLFVTDINGKETVLTKWDSNKSLHTGLSGWYEDGNKEGVYAVVEENDPDVDKIYADCKKHNNCDGMSKQDMMEYALGYEYFFIPKTGEVGKIGTYIGGYAKPVLYLYPEEKSNVTVTFDKPENLTTTYPKYKGSWNVTAYPNGDLYDKDNKYYYGLYWEEDLNHRVDFSEGFYVTSENAIEFLESKLELIGFNPKERNEFIMYWLPILEKNEKSLVYFELTKERNMYSKINISPKPDSMLRVAIHVKKVNSEVKIKEQKLETFNRVGFSAVEWGGVTY